MSQSPPALDALQIEAKYREIPRIIIRKIDAGIRGISFSDRALEYAERISALYDTAPDYGSASRRPVIGGSVFKDGTAVRVGLETEVMRVNKSKSRDGSYWVDVFGGQPWLVDGEEQVEPVYFVPVPQYWGKKTSRGTPMIRVVSGGSNILCVNVFGYCYFWQAKTACQFCESVQNFLRINQLLPSEALEDIKETIIEALKEEGRWTSLALVSGSDPRGDTPYQNEVEPILQVAEVIQEIFGSRPYTLRLITSAVPRKDLLRYKAAGVSAVEPHLEVWDKKIFQHVCPGKAQYFGWQYWVDNAVEAANVFGPGNVSSQFVIGTEILQPFGFKTEEEGLASILEGAEYFAQHGVNTSGTIFNPAKGSEFYAQQQKSPPLEYAVRATKVLHETRRKYRLGVGHNDFKRCGSHSDTDLARLFNHQTSEEVIPATTQERSNGCSIA